MQIIGTLFGAVINYILMTIITENQREILLSIRKYHSPPLFQFPNLCTLEYSRMYQCGTRSSR